MNGWPFITHHYSVFSSLNMYFQWHIIEGFAYGRADKSHPYSRKQPISIDKTAEYIDYLLETHSEDVIVHRAPYGKFWKDKNEMISVMHSILFSCIMMEIDVDELWTTNQLLKIYETLSNRKSKRCMYFNCHYFITKKYVTITVNTPTHMNSYEWIRAWKYDVGDKFISHAPPILIHSNYKLYDNQCYAHNFTEKLGLVFTHYSYTEDLIVRFKEEFYGKQLFSYRNWSLGKLPIEVSQYFGFMKWRKRNVYIDLSSNDIFGKNVSIVEYPKNIKFDYKIYLKEVSRVESTIKENNRNIFIIFLKANIKTIVNKILLDLLIKYKNTTVSLFVENVLHTTYLSFYPKIWYNNCKYIEIYESNIIYGYVKLLYVNNSFIINKKYKFYNALIF